MSKGTLVIVLVVAAYLAFELWALGRSGYRTKPLFVYEEFVAASRAQAQCGEAERAQQVRFEQNLAAVTRRARADRLAAGTAPSEAEVEALLAERRLAREAEVDALVDAGGCKSPEVWKLLKLYEARARLNLH